MRTVMEQLEKRRLLSAGSLDTTFNSTGKLNEALFADVTRVLVQPDRKILVASAPDVLLQGKGILQRYLPNGQFDPTFHDPNSSGTGYQATSLTTDIALTSNNEIVQLGGNSLSLLYSSGYHDPGFGQHGTAIPGTGVRMALAYDNSIIVAYTHSGTGDLTIRHYLADGTWDQSFGYNGDNDITQNLPDFSFHDLGVTFDGHVELFGTGPSFAGGAPAVVRLNPNGKTDTTFGSNGIKVVSLSGSTPWSVTTGIVTPDNKLLLGGIFNGQMFAVRLNSNGSTDTSFGTGGVEKVAIGTSSLVRSMTVGPDGRIYLAGRTGIPQYHNGDFAVVCLKSNGQLDTSFSGDGIATADLGSGFDTATSVAVDYTGRVIVGGDTDNSGFAQPLRMAMAVFQGSLASDSNDKISGAGTISLNSTTNASIGSPNDVDMFKLTVPNANQRVSFQVTQPGGEDQFDPFLQVFNSAGGQVTSNDGPYIGVGLLLNGGPSRFDPNFNFVFTSAGTYYIGISSRPNAIIDPLGGNNHGIARAFDGSYSLIVKDLMNVFDSHNKISNALVLPANPLGNTLSNGFFNSADVLMVKLNLIAGQYIHINLNTVAGGFDSYFRLFNSAGTQVAFNDNGIPPSSGETLGKDSYLAYTPIVTGTYYLGISSAKNKTYNPITGSGAVAGGAVGSFDVIFQQQLVLMP